MDEGRDVFKTRAPAHERASDYTSTGIDPVMINDPMDFLPHFEPSIFQGIPPPQEASVAAASGCADQHDSGHAQIPSFSQSEGVHLSTRPSWMQPRLQKLARVQRIATSPGEEFFAARENIVPPRSGRVSKQDDPMRPLMDRLQPPVIPAKAERDRASQRLRCPYSFHGDSPCSSTPKNIRDVIRHLQSHGCFFCSKCSQTFTQRDLMQRHYCDELMCIDLQCPNRPPERHEHDWRSGCRTAFNSLDKSQKWYALYALQFPAQEQPSWNDVCVTRTDISTFQPTNNSTETLSCSSTSPFATGPSTDLEGPRSTGNTSSVPDVGQQPELDFLEADISHVEVPSHVLFQQAATLVRGGVKQNRIIQSHGAQLTQQCITIETLLGELRLVQNKVEKLDHAISALTKSKMGQDEPESGDEVMQTEEID